MSSRSRANRQVILGNKPACSNYMYGVLESLSSLIHLHAGCYARTVARGGVLLGGGARCCCESLLPVMGSRAQAGGCCLRFHAMR